MKKNLKLKTLIPIAAIMVVIAVALTTIAIIDLGKAYHEAIEYAETDFDNIIRIATENMVSVLQVNHQRYINGEISEEEAYEIAKQLVRDVRYDSHPGANSDGYFWADMSDGLCVAHYNPSNDGANRWDTQDRSPEKIYYVRNIVALGNKGGYTEFYTGRVGDEEGAHKKRSYTLYFEPYKWFVSTGNYYSDIDEIIHAIEKEQNSSLLILIIVSLLATAAGIIILWFNLNGVVKPIVTLTAFMKRAGSTGDISVTPQEERELNAYMEREDEIGQLMTGSGGFVDHITHIADEIQALADGDLTVQIEKLSEKDVIGNAMLHVMDNLNHMFHEIQTATNQVSSGSSQVADGAQALASGSTQQAATLQELSASIIEIAAKTKENSERTGNASRLANSIMQNAEKGNQQMDEMIKAVGQINESSQNISKVIKVIDDIAFQTNILALNAAVEAARAGQHGKGFAVVAEEVRNLASKSAEAAKNTAGMIEDSMTKAELGTRIAGETAESLSEIVSGINESSQIISEIARSSEEQNYAISQINTAISNVTQVVQQNSATAEQSAAASEEMSSQGSILEDLISKFKLLH